MSIQLYQVAHIFAVVMLTAVVFGALAAPHPEHRRRAMMWSGILALVALVSGFGLLAKGGFGFQGWVIVKVACWLGLAVFPSLAFRRPGQARALRLLTLTAVFLAVAMVVMKPF